MSQILTAIDDIISLIFTTYTNTSSNNKHVLSILNFRGPRTKPKLEALQKKNENRGSSMVDGSFYDDDVCLFLFDIKLYACYNMHVFFCCCCVFFFFSFTISQCMLLLVVESMKKPEIFFGIRKRATTMPKKENELSEKKRRRKNAIERQREENEKPERLEFCSSVLEESKEKNYHHLV